MPKIRQFKQKYPQKYSEQKYEPIHSVEIRKRIFAKTGSQQLYMAAFKEADIIFGYGSAGVGKTYLAINAALEALTSKQVGRVVLTRPVVEAGEKLGYLPGSFANKLEPYLLPLMDAVINIIGPTKAKQLVEDGLIEIAPLAYLRGRTLSDCFIVADEMQNSTKEQMKMLLTRLGDKAVMAINGDDSSSDLPNPDSNGLSWAVKKLTGKVPSIIVVQFFKGDVVRHPIIEQILTYLESQINYNLRLIMLDEITIPYAKNLTKEDITKFLQQYLCKFKGFSRINADPEYGMRTAIFLDSENPDQLLIEINSSINIALNNYIESTFEESCKRYNRNIIFFESEAKGTSLFLRW